MTTIEVGAPLGLCLMTDGVMSAPTALGNIQRARAGGCHA